MDIAKDRLKHRQNQFKRKFRPEESRRILLAYRSGPTGRIFVSFDGQVNSHPTAQDQLILEKLHQQALDRSLYLTLLNEHRPSSIYQYLPQALASQYESLFGIHELHPWQVEALDTYDPDRNFLYSAPTAGGKSLVSDIIMWQQVYLHKKAVLIVLPYISLCEEKFRFLKPLCEVSRIKLRNFCDTQVSHWNPSIHISICTLEKANAIFNRVVHKNAQSPEGQEGGIPELLILDELHFLSDPGRGFHLEFLIIKVLLNKQRIQLVGTSATMPNLVPLAQWIKANHFQGHNRPYPLKIMLKHKYTLFEDATEIRQLPTENKKDPECLALLVCEVVLCKKSCMVFLPTRHWAEKSSAHIRQFLRDDLPETQALVAPLIQMLRKNPTSLTEQLVHLVRGQVGFHHAGLSEKERMIIEDGFRNRELLCLCSTSTLSAGVNLPCYRVIIRSLHLNASLEYMRMDPFKFHQMCGRAGRPAIKFDGKSTEGSPLPISQAASEFAGEAVIYCVNDQELKKAREFARDALPAVVSGVRDDSKQVLRILIDLLGLNLCSTLDDLKAGLEQSWWARYAQDLGASFELALKSLESLEMLKIEEKEVDITQLGVASTQAGLNPYETHFFQKELQKLMEFALLSDELQVLYVVCAWFAFRVEVDWDILGELVSRATKADQQFLDSQQFSVDFMMTAKYATRKKLDNLLDIIEFEETEMPLFTCQRLYMAFIMRDLLTKKPAHVAKAFHMSAGDLENFKDSTNIGASILICLADSLEMWTVSVLFAKVRDVFQNPTHFAEWLHELTGDPLVIAQILRSSFNTLEKLGNADPSDLLAVCPGIGDPLIQKILKAAEHQVDVNEREMGPDEDDWPEEPSDDSPWKLLKAAPSEEETVAVEPEEV